MSIYSDYSHGYITEAEFNSAAYREYAGENDHGYDNDDGKPASPDITACLESNFCDNCDGVCFSEWCDACLVEKVIKAVEGGKL